MIVFVAFFVGLIFGFFVAAFAACRTRDDECRQCYELQQWAARREQ